MKSVKLIGASVLGLALATSPLLAQITALGAGEGQVDIVAWPGYVERGETDKAFDWVTSFEKATGCAVKI